MLEIQKLLREGQTPEEICAPLGIHIRRKDHKVLFAYDQIESAKFKSHPIVKECRGLILYEDSWDICSMGFSRFLNYGEDGADQLPEDLKDCYVLEKLDGSYVAMYYDRIDQEWHCNTRSMIDAEGPVSDMSNMTFAQLFFETLKTTTGFLGIKHAIPKTATYVFELTSPYNRIVTKYDTPKVTLLTVRSNITGQEGSRWSVESYGVVLGCPVVKAVDARDWQELLKMENADGSKKDPQFEGYVIVKENGRPSHARVKLKNPLYVALHRVATSISERNLMDLIKMRLEDDFLAQFPEYRANALAMVEGLHSVARTVRNDWEGIQHIQERKEFALRAVQTKFPFYLFALWDGRVKPEGLMDFVMVQRTDALLDAIRKVGYEKHSLPALGNSKEKD